MCLVTNDITVNLKISVTVQYKNMRVDNLTGMRVAATLSNIHCFKFPGPSGSHLSHLILLISDSKEDIDVAQII